MESDRDQLESEQVRRLNELLSSIIPANRFYARKLEAAGVEPRVENLEGFRRRFPNTTKKELIEDQSTHPPYGTTLTYPWREFIRISITGGPTGSPIYWLDTRESW
jgi:phenylacetate-CoA ligase